MNTEQINTFYFSPTGTTETILNNLAANFPAVKICNFNLTLPGTSNKPEPIDSSSLSIVGMPVYSGRLPMEAIRRFETINGNQSLAIVIVVYGNREFDDALLELTELAQKANFRVIAAAAFVGEHSYSTTDRPIAHSRPDQQDLNHIATFADLVRKKLDETELKNAASTIQVPGNRPFVERKQYPLIIPETSHADCTQCGLCVECCPTGAINLEDEIVTDPEKCIWCCACVKKCPEQARHFDHEIIQSIRERLFTNCRERKEPQFYL
ncbi:EFR1 family ferrodoxin [Mangrovibacterium sp.]|uniref:EFR1 family ferrodoxin n=1 Tax=Mangrovibacterium sp. TaxID=1961364 RepID=UPI0035689721